MYLYQPLWVPIPTSKEYMLFMVCIGFKKQQKKTLFLNGHGTLALHSSVTIFAIRNFTLSYV